MSSLRDRLATVFLWIFIIVLSGDIFFSTLFSYTRPTVPQAAQGLIYPERIHSLTVYLTWWEKLLVDPRIFVFACACLLAWASLTGQLMRRRNGGHG